MERSWLILHNTKGHEGKYYVGNLLAKIRWAVCEGKFLKLGSFAATGICKENVYSEGGFEQSEVDMIVNSGGTSATLGKRILRAETAPLAALSIIMFQTGNLD